MSDEAPQEGKTIEDIVKELSAKQDAFNHALQMISKQFEQMNKELKQLDRRLGRLENEFEPTQFE